MMTPTTSVSFRSMYSCVCVRWRRDKEKLVTRWNVSIVLSYRNANITPPPLSILVAGIIASKRCNNVEIHDNVVYDGGENAVGIFLHRSSDDAKVYNNHVHDMQDAGLAIMESQNAEIYDNIFENVKYGMRISLGGANNYIHDNTFDGCTSCELEMYCQSLGFNVSYVGKRLSVLSAGCISWLFSVRLEVALSRDAVLPSYISLH